MNITLNISTAKADYVDTLIDEGKLCRIPVIEIPGLYKHLINFLASYSVNHPLSIY